MMNIIVLLIIGITCFREKHTKMEYLGAIIVLAGLVFIAFQRSGSTGPEEDPNFWTFYFGIFFTLMCSLFWGAGAVVGKYVAHHYQECLDEYALVAMIISGVFGIFSIVYLLIRQTALNPLDDGHTLFYVTSACAAGVFTILAMFFLTKSLEYGSVGIAMLYANMQPAVEMIEEFFVFSILPNTLGGIGMVLALLGASFVVLFTAKQTLGRKLWFNIFGLSAPLLFGTKMLCIGMSNIDEIWVYFFEHVAIFITGILIFQYVNW